MKIYNSTEARKHINETLYWDDIGSRYSFLRSGVLNDVYKMQLSFNDTQDYFPVSYYKNLRTTEEL